MEKTLKFYTEILGFENTFKMPDPAGNLVHANVVWKNVHIMFGPTTWLSEDVVPCRGAGVDFYILGDKDDDIDQFYAMLKEKGVNIVKEIEN